MPQAPASSHNYQQPVAPMTGATAYPPAPPPPYYGVAGDSQQPPPLSSPPQPSNSRLAQNFTTEGAPIVPVGISGGKMFRCRGFGECDKVFTRSEHLARHVRKHTGERPFPCHCGKAFSRLDNLRQHAATVHADQTQLNESMLQQLASVHAALSQRANREQRRRGEVVEVPKNAVERPRGERGTKTAATAAAAGQALPPGGVYPPAPGYPHQPPHNWAPPPDHGGRPRTSGSWVDYPNYPNQPSGEHPPGAVPPVAYPDDAGPSRRPPSSGGVYPHPNYYEQGGSSHGRPATAGSGVPPTASSDDSPQVQYPYGRPVSSNGPVAAAGNWTSPPTPHAGYPPTDPSLYPQPPSGVPSDSTHPYPPGHDSNQYAPPPPGSAGGNYYYPGGQQGQGYYGQQSPASQHPAQFNSVPHPSPSQGHSQPPPGESPFQYNAPGTQYGYQAPYYDANRKRRAEEDNGDSRKHPRSSNEGPGNVPPSSAGSEPRAAAGGVQGQPGQDPLWLPPAAERRSSLAISALLGSPHQEQRSRTPTGDAAPGQVPHVYAYDERVAAVGGLTRERPANDLDVKDRVVISEATAAP